LNHSVHLPRPQFPHPYTGDTIGPGPGTQGAPNTPSLLPAWPKFETFPVIRNPGRKLRPGAPQDWPMVLQLAFEPGLSPRTGTPGVVLSHYACKDREEVHTCRSGKCATALFMRSTEECDCPPRPGIKLTDHLMSLSKAHQDPRFTAFPSHSEEAFPSHSEEAYPWVVSTYPLCCVRHC
jgi:hypothetical protein